MSRSSIFSSQIFRGSVKRPLATTPLQIHAFGDFQIFQKSGYRLDQGDADVFYEIARLHLTSSIDLNTPAPIAVLRRDLIASIGRSKGGKTDALLDSSLNRLSKAKFIAQEKNGDQCEFGIFQNVLMTHGSGDDCVIQIEMDEKLSRQYSRNNWTLLRKNVRENLNMPVAKSLYSYFSSHGARPYPLLSGTVKEHVDRTSTKERTWLSHLRDALEELRRATMWETCELVDGRKIVIVKSNASQTSVKRVTKRPEREKEEAYFDI